MKNSIYKLTVDLPGGFNCQPKEASQEALLGTQCAGQARAAMHKAATANEGIAAAAATAGRQVNNLIRYSHE